MILLFDIAFPDATKYVSFAPTSIDYNSHSYENIVKSVNGMAENQGENKSYEVSPLEITLIDLTGEFKHAIYRDDSNRFIAGIEITIRKQDGTQLGIVKIDEWAILEGVLFFITASLKVDLTVDFTEKITSTIGSWSPNVPDEVINWVVPQAYNTITKMVSPMVDDRGSYHDYLLGTAAIATITNVYKRGQEWNSSYWSLRNDGTYYYVYMPHGVIGLGERYCLTSVTTAAYTPLQIITAILAGTITVATNASFNTFLTNQGYSSANTRFLVDRAMTAAEVLQIFCQCFECHYRLDSSGEVVFTWIDRDNISPVANFEQEEILEISQLKNYDPADIINKIEYQYDKLYDANKYNSGVVVYDGANQSDWGVRRTHRVDYEFLTESVQSAVTAAETNNLNKEPSAEYQISVVGDHIDSIYPGDLIRVRHSYLKTYPILFQVFRKDPRPEEDKIVLDIRDVDWLEPSLVDEIGYYILDGANRRINLR